MSPGEPSWAGPMLLECVGATLTSALHSALPAAACVNSQPAAAAAAAPQDPDRNPDADGLAFARTPALLGMLREAAEGVRGARSGAGQPGLAEEVRDRVACPAANAVLPALQSGKGGAAATALLALLIREHGVAGEPLLKLCVAETAEARSTVCVLAQAFTIFAGLEVQRPSVGWLALPVL